MAADWSASAGCSSTRALGFRIDNASERFPAKWGPGRVKKTRQIKNPEPRSDSIGTEKALVEASCVSHVPHDIDEHKYRGCPSQYRSHHHRLYCRHGRSLGFRSTPWLDQFLSATDGSGHL